ncbi:DUF4817 domain-containing protein [Trichonephila clavata]|uniref:DUF4817 domain-containing protein n=1 Tax=Trichonephila clavata TaxID=2740835 RepID=A0A8X6KAN7_TRICU|nr:DUF4817 domain-containing protein [Trichonephila clavata]
MSSMQEKAYYVFEYAKTSSVTVVRKDIFARNFVKNRRIGITSKWVKPFQDTGCLCKNKSPGRKETKPEVIERISDSCLRSPSKSTRRAGAELAAPHTTVWPVLQKRLQFKPYRYRLVQALKPTDKPLRKNF